MNTDSTERKKISDDAASNLYVIDDVIFYTNQSDYQNIYRVNTNGDNKELLVDFQYEPQCSEAMIVDENWLYYFDKPYHKLHRMDFDGTNVFDYAKDIGYNVNISDGTAYYTSLIPNESCDFAIYKTALEDGTEAVMLDIGNEYNPCSVILRGQWIYFIDE